MDLTSWLPASLVDIMHSRAGLSKIPGDLPSQEWGQLVVICVMYSAVCGVVC